MLEIRLPRALGQQRVVSHLDALAARERLVEGEGGLRHEQAVPGVQEHRDGEIERAAAATGDDDVLRNTHGVTWQATGATPFFRGI